MLENERRLNKRFQLNFPVIVSSNRAIKSENGWHNGKIVDASKNGIRLSIDGFGSLPVGTELHLVCQPATNHKCMPVPIKGQVVWEDAQHQQFALKYIQQ